MFLFEGNFGNILHTGDCRLTPECLQSLPDKYLGRKGRKPRCQLDYVFLDCTFGRFSGKIPSKHSAIRQVSMAYFFTCLQDAQMSEYQFINQPRHLFLFLSLDMFHKRWSLRSNDHNAHKLPSTLLLVATSNVLFSFSDVVFGSC